MNHTWSKEEILTKQQPTEGKRLQNEGFMTCKDREARRQDPQRGPYWTPMQDRCL